jgi:hypothetical protein
MKLYLAVFLFLLSGLTLSVHSQVKSAAPVAPKPSLVIPQKTTTSQPAPNLSRPAPETKATETQSASEKRNNGTIVLHWEKPFTENYGTEGPDIEYLSFKGALYDPKAHNLPEYNLHIKLNAGTNHLNISLINPVYQPLTPAELALMKNYGRYLSSDVVLKYSIEIQRKEPFAHLSFVPIRKNAGGEYEKLVSFSLNVQQSHTEENNLTHRYARKHQQSFASNSVLANGTWYKIGVVGDGIYKLDYAFFKNMGYNMTTLVPANIRIYGDGGAMLPDSNSVYRPDDLIENPIYVNGQKDSNFKTNDYVLFYGQGTTQWAYNNSTNRYQHKVNIYSDTTYYFVNADIGPGKRIDTELAASTPVDTVKTFDDYAYHELDAQNLIQSGSEWFGEYFDATVTYNFSFNFPNIVTSVPVYVAGKIVSRYSSRSYYQIGSSTFYVDSVSTGCYYCTYAAMAGTSYTFTSASPSINISVSKLTSGAIGWLYYLELNARRNLIMTPGTMEFRDMNSVGPGKVSIFAINSNVPLQVWDITNVVNPQAVRLTNSSGNYQFITQTDTLKQFMAFDGTSFGTAKFFGKIGNQNLHAMPQADLIIVTNSQFFAQANQLANFHSSHDGLKVNLVNVQQVYNEFSSGRQDPVAIRDFVRMFYNRSTNYSTMPKYLLLLGDASFDPKYRTQNNTDYVVSYESPESLDPLASFVSDDYYAVLDSNEGPITNGGYSLDIGVGRFPVTNVTDAQTLVNKVISYETPSGQPTYTATNCCTPAGQYNMGNWRNTVCFIAHDGDGGLHEEEADGLAQYVTSAYPNLNVNKIYCDAYPVVQSPGGYLYPEVNQAIDNQMNQGLLIINYTGHGGPTGLAIQRILTFNDIYSWTNANKLSLFFTASCEFSRFDNPLQVSAGQLCLTTPVGGNIGLMTTTRDVFSGGNTALNTNFYDVLYSPLADGTLPRTGDLFMEAKNATGPIVNSLMFAYLGDPAVRLVYPSDRVYTSSVSVAGAGSTDSLKALSKVTITGYVGDTAGNIQSNFNGLLYPTIYDKPDSLVTLDNPSSTGNIVFPFGLQNSILYKGMISVTNGNFSYSFVVPKDINYKYGHGKISYYAENGSIDATGNNEKIIIGGSSPFARNNGRGPQVRLYMNDSNFAFGGLTNQNPQLYAIVFDSNGINTTGNGIGHDITAVIDNNSQNSFDLTNYFQPALNSYQRGTITYPFSNLTTGTHSLTLRVWNVYNNSTQANTQFDVQQQSNLSLNHVLNYPNPFTTHTQFYFEVNEVCDIMDVQIQIFTVSGKLVKNIYTSVKTDSFRSQPIDWDGRDDFGDRIANGVYIYHLKVKTAEGATADTYQKLVIL